MQMSMSHTGVTGELFVLLECLLETVQADSLSCHAQAGWRIHEELVVKRYEVLSDLPFTLAFHERAQSALSMYLTVISFSCMFYCQRS
ncbi:hypothetical protein BDW67DRAFT_112997 [Aspergillus spinulosporus]